MPYIEKEKRPPYVKILWRLFKCLIVGKRWFEIKRHFIFCLFWLGKRMIFEIEGIPPRFNHIHDVIYSMHHAAHELERRYLDTYDDKKIKQYGDVE